MPKNENPPTVFDKRRKDSKTEDRGWEEEKSKRDGEKQREKGKFRKHLNHIIYLGIMPNWRRNELEFLY